MRCSWRRSILLLWLRHGKSDLFGADFQLGGRLILLVDVGISLDNAPDHQPLALCNVRRVLMGFRAPDVNLVPSGEFLPPEVGTDGKPEGQNRRVFDLSHWLYIADVADQQGILHTALRQFVLHIPAPFQLSVCLQKRAGGWAPLVKRLAAPLLFGDVSAFAYAADDGKRLLRRMAYRGLPLPSIMPQFLIFVELAVFALYFNQEILPVVTDQQVGGAGA